MIYHKIWKYVISKEQQHYKNNLCIGFPELAGSLMSTFRIYPQGGSIAKTK